MKKFGWKKISNYLINRSPNACQFRWRRLKYGNLKLIKKI
ncbi:SANT/Myb-like DNA-binding domain-containing protein [Streptomyces afghaniensis]